MYFGSFSNDLAHAMPWQCMCDHSMCMLQSIVPGSTKADGREPKTGLGRVFNSKLGCIATLGSKCMVCMQPLLKMKTRPKARPVS